jgi:hypothetical protein
MNIRVSAPCLVPPRSFTNVARRLKQQNNCLVSNFRIVLCNFQLLSPVLPGLRGLVRQALFVVELNIRAAAGFGALWYHFFFCKPIFPFFANLFLVRVISSTYYCVGLLVNRTTHGSDRFTSFHVWSISPLIQGWSHVHLRSCTQMVMSLQGYACVHHHKFCFSFTTALIRQVRWVWVE